MEGCPCDEPHCRVRDFLPFACPYCRGNYCLEHRSQFKHQCVQTAGVVRDDGGGGGEGGGSESGAQAVLSSVGERFDNDPVQGSSKEHSRIGKSSGLLGQLSSSTNEKLEKIGSISKNSALSQKERNISKATSSILLKTKAVGNKSIAMDSRVFLHVNFVATDTKVCLFFSKNAPLSEVLESIAQSMTHSAFGSTSQQEQMSLVLFSEARMKWQDWDLYQPLSYFFPDDCDAGLASGAHYHSAVEDVCIAPMATSVVVANQKAFRLGKAESVGNAAAPSEEDSATTSKKERMEAQAKPDVFKKGDRVLYVTSSDPAEAQLVEAVVVKAHPDDDPNDLFYTITIPSMANKEKQTVGSRLRPMGNAAAATRPTAAAAAAAAPAVASAPTAAAASASAPISDTLGVQLVYNSKTVSVPGLIKLNSKAYNGSSSSSSIFDWMFQSSTSAANKTPSPLASTTVRQLKKLIIEAYYAQTEGRMPARSTDEIITKEVATAVSNSSKPGSPIKMVYRGRILKDADVLAEVLQSRGTAADSKKQQNGVPCGITLKILIVGQ